MTIDTKRLRAGIVAMRPWDAPPVSLDELLELLAVYERYEAAPEAKWQPIETAPKDGAEVFVYVPGDSLFPTAASYKSSAYFEEEYGDSEYMEEGWYWAFGYPSDFHECVIEPTHWVPLPEPPQ